MLALWIFTFKGFEKDCSVDVYCAYMQLANEDDALSSIKNMCFWCNKKYLPCNILSDLALK